jgi:hypothetical protein
MIKQVILLYSLLFCLYAGNVNAQQVLRLTGSVRDSTAHAVEFAEVNLLREDSVHVKTAFTDSLGKFQLFAVKGNYKLTVGLFGKVLYAKNINLINDYDIGVAEVKISNTLAEVVITAQKRLIERKLDRLVFNVQNSIASQGMDLVEVLKNTPMVKVDDNGLSLIGKSGMSVMIDDRILNISGGDLINYLKSLRSEDVAKIEIITAPPAKYDAAGNSGIINIILKKRKNTGFSGNLSSSYTQTTYPGYANSANLNFQADRYTISVKLRQYHSMQKASEQTDLIGDTSLLSNTVRKDISYGIGVNTSVNYKLKKNSDIGFIYDISKTHTNEDINNFATYKTGNTADSILATSSNQHNSTLSQTLSIYYDVKLDTIGGKLSFGFNQFSNLPNKLENLQTTSDINPNQQPVQNSSNMRYSISSVQGDFSLPTKWAAIELGTKYTQFVNNSDVKYFDYTNQKYEIDSSKSNVFNYKEYNIAGYINANKDFNKKWSSQVGLRYEYSSVNDYSPTANQGNQYHYGKIFPSIYLQYKLNDTNTFNINYSKRINRPGFGLLNPFRWYSNPYIYFTGNPFLQPSFNHNIELNYLYKDILTVTIYGQETINGFSGITTFNNSIKELTFENYLTQYNWGITSSLDLNPLSWWEFYVNVVSYYSTSESAIKTVTPQSGFSASFGLNNTFSINRTKTVFLLLNFFNNLPSRDINVYSQGISDLSMGIKYSLLNKTLNLNATVEDVFKGTVSKGTMYYENFIQTFNNYYDNRRISLSVSYNFGNKNIKAKNKQIQFSEKARAN